MKDFITNKGKAATNSVLPQLAVTCKIGADCSYQTSMQVDSEVLRNRQLRQHANRYNQWLTWAFTILQTKTYPDEFRLLV